MPGSKYKFNPETLKYEPVNRSLLKITGTTFAFIGSVMVLFLFLYLLVFQNFFDTPEEKTLKRENSQLLLQIKTLNHKFDKANQGITELKERDKKIYRALLGGKNIPEEIWDAGYGGSDRYEQFQNLKNAEILIETNKKLDKLQSHINIQKTSYLDVINMAIENEQKNQSIPAIQPISNKDLKRFASGWGMRTHPIYKIPKFHTGIDFTAPKGTEVYATGDGIVEVRRNSGTNGNLVVINHGFGIKTSYAHLNGFNVNKGQKIKRGEILGYVGNTGQSVGDHLHYEVLVKGKQVNPINYFFNDLSIDEFEKLIKMSTLASKSLD